MTHKLLDCLIVAFCLYSCNNFRIIENAENSSTILSNNKDKVIISKIRYENGNLAEISFECDSLQKFDNGNATCISIVYSFYSNGNLKEKGFQGTYNGYGVPVGTWYHYDLERKLITKTHYHNDEFGKDFILIEHYKNGIIEKVEKYNNYILYETEKKIIK